METLQQRLVLGSAVARENVILAEYVDQFSADDDSKSLDFGSMTGQCLEHIPPLHSRFSYTTCSRRFLSIIDGNFICCAVVDEALSKAEGFAFLENVRKAFKGLLVQLDVKSETLGHHSMQGQMQPVFERLVAPIVGVPQKEKDRIKREEEEEEEEEQEEELVQIDSNGDLCFGSSSTNAAVPTSDSSNETSDPQPHPIMEENARSRSWFVPLIGRKGKRKLDQEQKKTAKEIKLPKHKNKVQEEKKLGKEKIEESKKNEGKHVEITVAASSSPKRENAQIQTEEAHRKWCQSVGIVVILDVVICLVLLAIWLAVCEGVQCVKKK